jgi:hypothetical protein
MDTTIPPLASIGIDIGKEVFHVVGFSTDGRIAFRRKIKRLSLVETFKRLPPSIVGMEACLSAHFVSRALRQLGHEPRIIPAIYVRSLIAGLYADWIALVERVDSIANEIEKISEKEANLPAPHERSRHWPPDLDRRGRSHWYRRGIRTRARFRGMAWSRATPVQHRWPIYPGPHLQERQQVSQNPVHTGRKRHPDAPAQLGAFQLRSMASKRSSPAPSQQVGNRPGQQTGADRMEHLAQREGLRHPSSRGDSYLSPLHPSSRQRERMERIDERIKSLVTQMVARQPVR